MEEKNPIVDPFSELKTMVRKVTMFRAKQYFHMPEFRDSSVDTSQVPVFGHWMSMIMVAGSSLRLTYKVQYNTRDIYDLAGALSQGGPIDVSDLMKEFCNVTAGLIKNRLENQQVKVGISLPMVTRGFDEFFHKFQTGSFSSLDAWKLVAKESQFTCLLLVEIFDDSILKLVQGISNFDEASFQETKGMEFL